MKPLSSGLIDQLPAPTDADQAKELARIITDAETAYVVEQLALVKAGARGNENLEKRGRSAFITACLRAKREGDSIIPQGQRLPSLQSLEVSLHRHVEYKTGRSDCSGEMVIEETFGKRSGENGEQYVESFVSLRCRECGERVTLRNPLEKQVSQAARKSDWRNRKDH